MLRKLRDSHIVFAGVVSLLLFVAITAATMLFWGPVFHRFPFALYFGAVAYCALFLGWGWGMGFAVAGVLAIFLFDNSPEIVSPAIVLLGVSTIISFLANRRNRAIAALRESERQHRLMVENVRDYGMFMMDLRGHITRWNIGAERVLGWSQAEIVGKTCDNIFLPEDREAGVPQREKQRTLRDGHAADERWHLRKDGSRFYAVGMMMRVDDEEGNPIGFTKVLRDMTQQRLAVAERELLLEQEKSARELAEAASRAKDDFLATVSHELRTPMTAIIGWASILHMHPEPETLAEGLDAIQRNAQVQAQLIDDILDIARITSGKLRLNMRDVELSQVIDAAIATVKSAADAKHIRLVKEYAAHGHVWGDPDRLQQIFWNLLANAIKFTPKRGEVRITTESAASKWMVKVTDSGKGINPEFLPHIFERFRQADSSTTRRHGGLGLGLSIVRHMVELHGGTVSALSEGEDKGSTFIVELPIAAIEREGAAGLTSFMAIPKDDAAICDKLAGLRVLVLDDEPDARRVIEAVLARCGVEVTLVGSVGDAMGILMSDHAVDAVISDIAMPEEDGYAFIRRLRTAEASRRGKNVPVAALTAYTRPEDRQHALEAGFNSHIPKPVQPGELIEAVAHLARREVAATNE